MDGRKIYFNDWITELVRNINKNKKVHEFLLKEDSDSNKQYHQRGIDICKKLLEKIEQYKKSDEEGRIYLWLFPRELENIMWIYMENDLVFSETKEDNGSDNNEQQ